MMRKHKLNLATVFLLVALLLDWVTPNNGRVLADVTITGNTLPGKVLDSPAAKQTNAFASSPDNTFTVTNTADSGLGSLRQAILDANAAPGIDSINFNIGTPGTQQTIALTTALPGITDAVILDGWSQGGGGYTGPPLVEVNGSGIANWNLVDGLLIAAGNSTVRGLAINYFNIAINLTTAGNNVIVGNTLGLALDGVTSIGNRTGMRIAAASDNNRIGTDGDGVNDTAERNIISASGFVQQNNSTGMLIDQGSDNNWIAGNYIGTDANGTLDRGNADSGIVTGGVTIIGTNGDGLGDAIEGNLISGNNSHGITLASTSSGSNVAGNKVGTDASGAAAIPNNFNGVSVGSCSPGQCSNYTIGTDGDGISDALEGNLISGNGAGGVYIPAGTLANNVVAGNKIGTDTSGMSAIPNGDYGVHLGGDLSRLGTNSDGLSDDLENNLISGNGDGAGNDNHGVVIPSGADHHLVAGNKIGTNADGLAALPNGQTGLHIGDDANTIIGNLISGNGEHGIQVSDAFFNTLTDNLIGVAVDGVAALGNTLHGVYISTNSDDNTLGGTGAGEGNVIAFNGGDGVFVDNNCGAGFCLRNLITGNAIFDNTGLGIDLSPNGVNPNDPLDPDTGANSRQNYPVLSAANAVGANIVVIGTLNSTISTTFTLDFYSSSTCDSTGSGEGELYLGAGQVTTDANGDASFTISVAGLAANGDSISATAADPVGNTSEFSTCIPVVGEEPISGLQAFNDSPTNLGLPTHLTATLATGTGVSFIWDFGDGGSGSGTNPSHTYAATGSYTATVTASNSLGSASAATGVTILPPLNCAATPDDGATVFASLDAGAVQQAVGAASPGATVKIAGACTGVSSQGGNSQTVYIDMPLTLSGGFSVSNWSNPDPVNFPTHLDAGGLGRVIFITSTVPVTIENLFIVNGDAAGSGTGTCPGYGCGGGVFTNGALNLINVDLRNNSALSAAGAYVAGALDAVDTTWMDNTCANRRGGAFEVYGDALIIGGLLQGNACRYAGGIFSDSSLVITGTQFISNTANNPSVGSGGAIYAGGELILTNAHFQGNTAFTGAGAVLFSPGVPDERLAITGTHFTNNTTLNATAQGGALYVSGAGTVHSSTFEGNSAPGSSAAGGAIVAFQAITLTETVFISNTAGGQGGAIYHWGLSKSGSTDQVYPLVISDSRLAGNQAGGEGGGLYFRRGFAAANTPIHLFNTTVEDNTAGLDGGGAYLGQPGDIANSLFHANSSPTAGGGLYTEDRLILTQTTFQGNLAARAGGAYVLGALTADDSDWLDNSGATQRGGGIEVYGEAVMTGGLVQGNAAAYGGGIFADAGLAISGTQFISNSATSTVAGSGGAIYAAGILHITDALFQGNQSYTGAGAVLHSPGTNEFLSITNTLFSNNTALHTSAQGGALYTSAASSTIQSSLFQGNSAPGSSGRGGAIVAFKAITLTETALISNTVGGQGGAIYHWGLSETGNTNQIYPLEISNSLLVGNQAGGEGGGLYFRRGFDASNNPVQITGSTFQSNLAGQDGGGSYLGQPAELSGSLFLNNTSQNAAGGGLALDGGTASARSRVTNTVFADNQASNSAGIYATGAGRVDVLHTTLADSSLSPVAAITVDGPSMYLTNTILVSHTVGIELNNGIAQVQNSLFFGNLADTQGGVTNLNPVFGDPRFLDPAYDDYHLALGSTAIDAAVDAGVGEDLDGDLRPIIGINDIGADEFGTSTVAEPGTTTTVTSTVGSGQQIIIIIPPGALGGRTTIQLLPVFPPKVPPRPPRRTAGTGFIFLTTPITRANFPTDIDPTFSNPVEIKITYLDADTAGIDEDSLFLAVLDEASGEWIDATLTCPTAGTISRNTQENQIRVTTCATGEFALLGDPGMETIYLPMVARQAN